MPIESDRGSRNSPKLPKRSKKAPSGQKSLTIQALNLTPSAEAAARKLKEQHPEIVFTSGRRTVHEQARAMASNIVDSKDRQWIKNTYAFAAKLQKWVDDHKEAVTVTALVRGLEETMNAMKGTERAKISKHLTGEAFDIQPVEGKDAAEIKRDIRALPQLDKFFDKEGGLVRWHAQFTKR